MRLILEVPQADGTVVEYRRNFDDVVEEYGPTGGDLDALMEKVMADPEAFIALPEW